MWVRKIGEWYGGDRLWRVVANVMYPNQVDIELGVGRGDWGMGEWSAI